MNTSANRSSKIIEMFRFKNAKSLFAYLAFITLVIYNFLLFLNYFESSRIASPLFTMENSYFSEDDTKTILLWNPYFHNYDYVFGTDGSQFGPNKCPVENCVVTSDRTLMKVEDYDAIVFHSWGFKKGDGPSKRNYRQYYAFVSLEPPTRNTITSELDDYFNWTVTYRLDSDFSWPYFKLKNNTGFVVSPSLSPQWDSYDRIATTINRTVLPTLLTKKRAAAWFVSHCLSHNARELYVKELQKYIEVDVYGLCGPLHCVRSNETKCFEMMRNTYYFYIAFENSHCVDYMTEKAYNALMFDTIPILYGRANYTNFIPPHSYIDASVLNPEQLSLIMQELMETPDEYAKYFWWKDLYTFHNLGNEYLLVEPDLHPFCEMCKSLNDPDLQVKRYEDLRQWWQMKDPSNNGSDSAVCVRPQQLY